MTIMLMPENFFIITIKASLGKVCTRLRTGLKQVQNWFGTGSEPVSHAFGKGTKIGVHDSLRKK